MKKRHVWIPGLLMALLLLAVCCGCTSLAEEALPEQENLPDAGGEEFYRYLQEVIIPEYGWAKTGTMEWTVASLTNSDKGDMADAIAAYQDPETGEAATGVVSAIVRDFDGDGAREMLVLFLDTAPINGTALSPVYKDSTAIVLRAKLFGAGTGEDQNAVAELDSIDLAGEFYGLGYGTMKAGLYVLEDVLYFYTSESMDDSTTFGPGVYRIWHVEEGRFVFDYASRSIGWGQGSFEINLGDNGTDFGQLRGSVESGILLQFSAEIIRYYNPGPPTFRTELEDRTYIRRVLEEGEGILLQIRGEDPVRTKVEVILNPWQDKAKEIAAEIAAASGISMSFSRDYNDTTGLYWVSYSSEKGTGVTVYIDLEGNITSVGVSASFSEEHGEWLAVKDAALLCEKLGLPQEAISHFSGDCGRSDWMDLEGGGYIMLGSMDNIFMTISLK